jgi:LacI family transcriptional regulator
MRDIARRAGVSQPTVSMALRNHPSLPEETCQKIQRIAQEMGYRLNPMLSALASYRWSQKTPTFHGTLAWIDNSPTKEIFEQRVRESSLRALSEKHAQHLGYQLETFWLQQPGVSHHRLSQILRARNISGLLIAPQSKARGHLHLAWNHFSVVTFGLTLTRPVFHSVSHDPFQSMRVSLRKLRGLGYRRIAYATSSHWNARTDHHWEAAFLLEQQRFDAKDRIPPYIPQAEALERSSFLAWLRKAKPQAVISAEFKFILSWLKEENIGVPSDLGLVVPDILSGATCAGVQANHDMLTKAAVNLVINMIQRNETGIPSCPQRVQIEGKWVQGDTVRRLTR